MGIENKSEDIVLDFSRLFGKDTVQAPECRSEPPSGAGGTNPCDDTRKPLERLPEALESQQAKLLYIDAQRERENLQRSLEVYRIYQENIRLSEQLQTEILNGLKAGEPMPGLFLKAAKAISLMTGNSAFYSQIEADMRATNGEKTQELLGKNKPDAQKRLLKPFTALDGSNYRAAYRTVCDFHERNNPPRLDDDNGAAYWENVCDDMCATASQCNQDKFVIGLLVAVYEELERQYLEINVK
uniref:Uncharacterized protein n=1 Tax=uncultured prokaryote TaxID=198431 RepID=A0A0H5PWQ2_9ZZZZ|nr:hypothetical protein [uncultured prokaryote]